MAFRWLNLGMVPYQEAVRIQECVSEQVKAGADHTLILCEHPPVLTLGANFHDENLLLPLEAYRVRGIEVVRTDRGGDVTYHGPGQLVIYPIFDLSRLQQDLHWWLRQLEETLIVALQHWSLIGERSEVNTGVWISEKKVAAIGIKVSRWVSRHGCALNCDVDLSAFELIHPCGIRTHGVTSIKKALKLLNSPPVEGWQAKPDGLVPSCLSTSTPPPFASAHGPSPKGRELAGPNSFPSGEGWSSVSETDGVYQSHPSPPGPLSPRKGEGERIDAIQPVVSSFSQVFGLTAVPITREELGC